jgi:hypothetical protein
MRILMKIMIFKTWRRKITTQTTKPQKLRSQRARRTT